MNKGFLVGLMMLLLLSTHRLAVAKSPWETELPFEHATIRYTISGTENGEEIIYIRDYGREVATLHTTNTNMMGITMTNTTMDLSNPNWEYSFDLTNHTGTKSVNPEKYMILEYNKLSQTEKLEISHNAEKMTASVVEGFGGQILKNAKKIHGYECDRVEMMGTVTYSIHGTDIPLLVESDMMGIKMKIEATSVETGKVDLKHFLLPEEIEPVLDPRSDAIAQNMAKETISMLQNPEGTKKLRKGSSDEELDAQQQFPPEQKNQAEQAMQILQGLFGGKSQ